MPTFSANQERFPIEAGDTLPGFIQRDMQMIEKGSNEIDKLLSRAASIVGCPRSVFDGTFNFVVSVVAVSNTKKLRVKSIPLTFKAGKLVTQGISFTKLIDVEDLLK